MAKVRLKELMEDNNIPFGEMAAILWPDTKKHTAKVMLSRWLRDGIVSIRLDQLQRLHDRFGITNIIEYEEVEP